MTPAQSDGSAGRVPTATLTFVVTAAGVLGFLFLIRRILLPLVAICPAASCSMSPGSCWPS